MTIPNVTTSLDDDTFFVDLNGEDTAEHITVFIDLQNNLINAIGNTNERNQNKLTVSSVQDWVYRLYSEEATGVLASSVLSGYGVSEITRLPFLHYAGTDSLNQPEIEQFIRSVILDNSGFNLGPSQYSVSNAYSFIDLSFDNPVPGLNTNTRNTISNFTPLSSNSFYSGGSNLNNIGPVVRGSTNYNVSSNLWLNQDQGSYPAFTYYYGFTGGNQFANQGYKRWPYGPIGNWSSTWWAVYNFLRYGGQALIVSSPSGTTASMVNDIISDLSKSNLDFDSITCLNGVDNYIARKVANTRKDCVAITTVDESFFPTNDTKSTGYTGGPVFTGYTGGIQFRLKWVDNFKQNSDFGSSADLKQWANETYLDDYMYSSGVANYNVNTGEITKSTIGLQPGEAHIARNYLPLHKLTVRPRNLDPQTMYMGYYHLPGIFGTHWDHPFFSWISFNGQPLSGPLTTQGYTYEQMPASYLSAYPTKELWFPLRTPNPDARYQDPLWNAANVFYCAGDVKVFGASGEGLTASILNYLGVTESPNKILQILQGISGSSAANDNKAVVGVTYDSSNAPYIYIDDQYNKNFIGSRSGYDLLDLQGSPNLNGTDDSNAFIPPFIDVRKSFDKAREQYNLTSGQRPTISQVKYIPHSEGNGYASGMFSEWLKYWDYSNAGMFGVVFDELPDWQPGVNDSVLFGLDLTWALNGFPSARIDSGLGENTPVPSESKYTIPTEIKHEYFVHAITQNWLEFQKRVVALLNAGDIYSPDPPSATAGDLGWWLAQDPERVEKYWGCTCANLPQFFREYLQMGTSGGGIPMGNIGGFDAQDLDDNGYTPIDCFEFGPNGTTTDVLAPGSTYCAFIAFRDQHPKLYLHHQDANGNPFGETGGLEYPNLLCGSDFWESTTVRGTSFLYPSGVSLDYHPGYCRGGTMAGLYLPYLDAPLMLNKQGIPNYGIKYGMHIFYVTNGGPYQPGADQGFGNTIQFRSTYIPGGD